MTPHLAAIANTIVSLAYFAITFAIVVPLARAKQLGTNRLGTATAAIFFSCGVGHGFHSLEALRTDGMGMMAMPWYAAAWDLLTACVAVYYWTLRRIYGQLMQGATLFEDLQQQQRLVELEHRDAVASARSRAERERDAHANLLSSVISNSQSVVSVKDLAGRYLLANRPFEEAFGVREADLLGKTDAWLDPVLATTWREHDLRAQHEQFTVEECVDRPDGRRYYESVKFPMYDADGTVYATCGMSLDITARRRADAEMARARDVALAATAAKSAFLATMSHEIRTPMNAVIGMTGLLLDTELDDQQRDFVETVRNSGDALLVVINDILDFSKIEAGELHLEREPFDLRACAESSLDLIAQSAAGKGLDLVLDVADDCPGRVVGDASRLRQVLVNLLSNAVKFTAAGEVLLEVRVGGGGAPGTARLELAVRDTGIGIPADRLDRLFQSFSQVDASTTRLYGGTGLGLAISRRLVEAMGGRLEVRSTLDLGSTFTVSVDLTVAEPERTATGVLPADLAGRRVLVVDDNATSLRVLGGQLEAWGMTVATAGSVEQALRLVELGSLDVAVLDLHLADADARAGAEPAIDALAAAVRALPGGRGLPLVALPMLGDRPDPSGAIGYAAQVPKPVRRSALLAGLVGALSVGRDVPTPAAAGHGRSQDAGRLRVLLAEDNEVNQKVARLMLAALGHQVDAVGNGREAVEAVRHGAYDLVLMDVHMPELDGLQATRVLRAELPADRQPHIVALTASVLLEDREACTEAGMDDHLAKPVRKQQLIDLLDRVPRRAAGKPGSAPSQTQEPHVPQQAPPPFVTAAPPSVAAAPPGTDVAPFDTAVIDDLVRSLGERGPALRHDLLSSYVREGDARVLQAAQAVATGDADVVRRVAHTMRSSSRVLGLVELADLFDRLEVEAERAAGGNGMTAALLRDVDRAVLQYRRAAAGIAVVLRASAPAVSA